MFEVPPLDFMGGGDGDVVRHGPTTCWATGCSDSTALPLDSEGLQRRGLGAWLDTGDLVDQFAGNRVGEALEILDDQQERAWPADYVFLVIVRKPARRLSVHCEARPGLRVDDRQPVDGDALGHRLVARLGNRRPGVAGAVARNIDDPPRRVRRRAGELPQ